MYQLHSTFLEWNDFLSTHTLFALGHSKPTIILVSSDIFVLFFVYFICPLLTFSLLFVEFCMTSLGLKLVQLKTQSAMVHLYHRDFIRTPV